MRVLVLLVLALPVAAQDLQKGPEIRKLLASRRHQDWSKAFRLLRREPFGQKLDQTIVALAKDPRPAVRYIAIKLAVSSITFGRAPKELVDVVLAGFADPAPTLVASLIVRDAYAVRDKRVVDRMVALLGDRRPLRRDAPPMMNMGTAKTLGEVATYHLASIEYQERMARWRWRGEMPPKAPRLQPLKPAAIAAWWKKGRAAFAFGAPASHWKPVFDKVLILDLHKPVAIRLDDGTKLTLRLKKYKEGWRGGSPVTTIELDVYTHVGREQDHVATIGNPEHDDGFVPRSRGTGFSLLSAEEATCRAAFLPTHKKGRVRVRLTFHASREN